MLIRSQDRKSLFNLMTMQNLQINKESECYCVAAYFTQDDMATIGKYTTQEKAINVLDLIQEDYENSCTVEAHIPGCDPYMFIHNAVFRMPLDSEVSEE
ncbi:MAG TPA: hypothetical protein DEQ64_14500 [Lachnoclostridium sp.]|jgi:hypothetical protein|uniref:hypothetical protein n=1 Tax=Lacrimispora sp. TaxID=2719234 RepID=UPI000EDD23C5|nr:hypothetical protein [Lacrimispora sp.]HCD44910.1 hypothetical protein [Lachnoclostridium sp.]